ncbi:exonuclease domain-containing protein [Fonticella tunisiensis]|uniref:DNA polymerase III epsilon subunit family exonuclease n=1 Tax=Fonticella tunisiensis TaxID=1096341 RepID=A0A4V3ETP7_9CLOT|nr:exonuclease domain-containing protein [Fonticella tunisiensis]TDT63385.1 DNA polymerase III epsilon subunit family exonuclease [Fonticella tunisiensis]
MKNISRKIIGVILTIIITSFFSPIFEKIENPFLGFFVLFIAIYISYKLGFKLANKLFKYNKIKDIKIEINNNENINFENKPEKIINNPNYSLEAFDEFVVLDFETTGLNPSTDKIIEVSILKYKNGVLIDEFQTLINPLIKIPPEITRITGISNNMVKDKPTIKEVLPLLIDFIGDLPIVAHNAPFDAKFLKYAVLYNLGEDMITNKFIDTVKVARKIYPNLPNHKLTTIKEYLDINLNSHRAHDDTLVTAQIYLDYIKFDKTLPKQKKEPSKPKIEPSSFSELDFPPMFQNEKPGYYQGKHYTDYVDLVKELKRAGEYDKAEKLLLCLVEAVESESKKENWGVAPWYYEQLAIIYRKQKNLSKEIEILERYSQQKKGPGGPNPKLLERLESVQRKLEIN